LGQAMFTYTSMVMDPSVLMISAFGIGSAMLAKHQHYQ
jgi:hypothetical protein